MKIKPILILLTIGNLFSIEAQEKKQPMNPFYQSYNTPFNVPAFDKIKTEHFKPAILEGIKRHQAEIDAIANNPAAPTFDNTILAMENAGELLSEANRVFGNYNSANTNEQIQTIAKEIAPEMSAHGDNISLN
jgi:peptidyl-dipeptidase Dcp